MFFSEFSEFSDAPDVTKYLFIQGKDALDILWRIWLARRARVRKIEATEANILQ
jgi:hypothetical protein